MSTRFIGNGNGLSIMCNHGDVSTGQRPLVDADGKPVIDKTGAPTYEHVFPAKCAAKITTGQILRSGIRHYAGTVGWFSVEMSGRLRDFCTEHAKPRREYVKAAKAERERIAEEKKAARAAVKQARLEERDRKREERKAAKAAKAAARLAKKAA